MHIFYCYGTVLTVVSSSLVIWLEFLHTTSSLSFPRKIPVSAKQLSVRAWLWMLDVRAARCVFGLAHYKRLAALSLAHHARRRSDSYLFCVLAHVFLARKSYCSRSRFPVDFCGLLLFLLLCQPLVPRHRGSLNHFDCRIKNKEVHFSGCFWNQGMVGHYLKLKWS